MAYVAERGGAKKEEEGGRKEEAEEVSVPSTCAILFWDLFNLCPY